LLDELRQVDRPPGHVSRIQVQVNIEESSDRMAGYPQELRYTVEHEWVKSPGNAATGAQDLVVRVGITGYAQEALGDIVYVSLPEPGTSVAAGDALGEVESTKSVSDVYAPLTGEVVSRNDQLSTTPELINSDPYGEGWLIEIRVTDPAALDALLDAAGYASHVEDH
jgi:glycine cleavage system H protein